MRQDDLDRILSTEQALLPSSGFLASVMDAVGTEAAAPPPIPFPWKRALPGLAVAALALLAALAVGISVLLQGSAAQPVPPDLSSAIGSFMEVAQTVGAGWILLGLLLSFVLVKLSMRIVAGRV